MQFLMLSGMGMAGRVVLHFVFAVSIFFGTPAKGHRLFQGAKVYSGIKRPRLKF